MVPAPRHKDDKNMRESLYKLNILDTPLEERFERITRMVCMTLGVPISAFSLIDGERQWFKSIQGLDATENTRAESFCAYTILGDDVMVVPDARKDIRFSTNPLVTGNPNISFYAGCPVRAPDGRSIGSLCAIDNKTRDMNSQQVQALRDLAQMLESELKVAQLSKAQYDLINELDAANRLLLIDATTRLWNRDGMMDILSREWAAAIRKNEAISLVMAEIDDMRTITETHGDAAAELVTKEIAKRLLAMLRAEDAAARLENEKFLLLLTDCPADKCFDTAERIREGVTAKPIQLDNDQMLKVSMSFGAATGVPNIVLEPQDLISAAESGLTKAKSFGHNRTELATLD